MLCYDFSRKKRSKEQRYAVKRQAKNVLRRKRAAEAASSYDEFLGASNYRWMSVAPGLCLTSYVEGAGFVDPLDQQPLPNGRAAEQREEVDLSAFVLVRGSTRAGTQRARAGTTAQKVHRTSSVDDVFFTLSGVGTPSVPEPEGRERGELSTESFAWHGL